MRNKLIIAVLLVLFSIPIFGQLDRSKQPGPGPAPEIQLGDYESFELDNGLKVFVVENHKLPRVAFQLTLDRDPILEGENAGYIEAAGSLLGTATKTKTKDQIDEEVDFIGATLNAYSTGMYARSLTKHTETLVSLMADIILNAEFKQEELDKFKKKKISGLQAEKDSPSAIAAKVRSVLLYGKDHPYGEVITEKTVESITLEMCNEYFKTYFRPNIGYLAIVGDITVDEAKDLMKKYLSDWKKAEVPTHKYKKVKTPLVKKVAIVDRSVAVQSVINITYPIDLKVGDENAIKASVLNQILGGSASGRLFQNLREDKAFTYGAYSRISPNKLVGNFRANCEARNEVTDSAITELFSEMKTIRNELVSEDELEAAKKLMTGTFAMSLENPQTIARFAINIERYNLPKDYYKNYLKNLKTVTVEDVKAMAKKYIKPKNAYVLVVGSADEIAEKLKRFSTSGKVAYYDIYGDKYDPNVKKVDASVTVQSVIDDYLTAIGGKDKLLSIKDKTVKMKGKMQGMNIVLTMMQKTPNKLYLEIDFGVGKQKTILDGEKAKTEAMGQVQEITGDKLEDLKLQNNMYLLLDYAKYNVKAELSGKEDIDGAEAYKIVLIYPTGSKQTEYYDVASGFKVREVSTIKTPQGEFTQKVDMKDYKEFNGMQMPSKMIQTMGPQSLELEVTSIEINTGLSDVIFKVD